MSNELEQTWRDEFDKKFNYINDGDYAASSAYITNDNHIGGDDPKFDLEDIVKFIESLLSKQEEKLLADFKKVLDSDLYTLTAVVELEKKEMVEKLDWEEQMENKILIDCFNPNEQTLNMPKLLNLISSTINQAVDEQLKDIIKLNNKVYDPIELEILLEKKLNLGSKP